MKATKTITSILMKILAVKTMAAAIWLYLYTFGAIQAGLFPPTGAIIGLMIVASVALWTAD